MERDLTVFTAAHQIAPHNAPVELNLARAHVQVALQLGEAGRCNEAVVTFNEVIREIPQDWYAWPVWENVSYNSTVGKGRAVTPVLPNSHTSRASSRRVADSEPKWGCLPRLSQSPEWGLY